MKTGKIIAAFGLPGSGKSSVTSEIGRQLGIKTFHEPEEKSWADAVKDREVSGNFTAIMWFRSIRVPMLYEAEKNKKEGKMIMLDSYYDKLFSLYMDKDGMQWLFKKNDDYYNEMKLVSGKDYKLLPDVDLLIFFYVDMEIWLKFLAKRNRNLDNELEFRKTCFASQNHFLAAAQKYCTEKKCQLIIHKQKYSSPEDAALEIIDELKHLNLLQ